MNKRLISQIIGLTAAITAGAVELPLTNPAAPFVRKANADAGKTAPVFDAAGKRFIFGSKVFQVYQSGLVNISDSGKQFGFIYFGANTPYSCWMINRTIAERKLPVKYTKGSPGIDSFTTDEKNKSFTVTGKIPFQKPADKTEVLGTYQLTFRLLPENRIRVRLETRLPDGFVKNSTSLMCKLEGARRIKTPQKEYTAPGKKGQINFGRPKDVRVFTDLESQTLRLIPQGKTTLYAGARGYFSFGCPVNKKDPGHFVTEFDYDPVNWSGKASFGAVDLRTVDDLDPEQPCGRNLYQNPYFAQGLNHVLHYSMRYEFNGVLYTKLSKDNPKFGEYCLVTENRTHSVFLPMISAERGDYTFSWYARADHPKGAFTSIHVCNHSHKTLHPVKRFPVGREWKRYQVTVSVKGITGMHARFSFGSSVKGPYKVYMDGFQLEKGKNATAFDCSPATSCLQTSAKDDFICHGDKINGKLRLSTLQDKVSGKLNVSVQDIFGTELYKTSSQFDFGKNEHPVIPLALDGKIPDGVFKVKVDFDVNGKKYTEYFRFSVMPFFSNKHKIRKLFAQSYRSGTRYIGDYPGFECFIRRSTQYGSGADSHQEYPTKENDAMLAKYGFELTDVHLGSHGREKKITKMFPGSKPVPGHLYYYIDWSDSVYDSWKGKGGLVLDHRLSGGWTPEFRRRVVKAVESIVRKSSKRRFYGFGSEMPPEIKNDPHYIDLLMAMREGVKKVYPDAKFVEEGACNMDAGNGVREIDGLLTRMKGKIPVEGIQTHTYTGDILDLEPNFKALVDVVENKHGLKNMSYYFGEGMHYYPYNVPDWGLFSTSWNGTNGWYGGTISYDIGWTEKKVAAYFMRSWLIFLTKINQVVSSTSSAMNSRSIYLDAQLRPRVYQKIPNTLSLLLGNAKDFVKDVSFAKHTKCLIWEDEKGRPVAAVWYQEPLADQGQKQGPWAMAKLPAGTEIFDMMGVKRTPRKDGRFPVSIFPFFFRGQPGEVDVFVKAFANAEIVGDSSSPFRTSIAVTSRTEAELTLENFKARTVSGKVTAGGKTTNVKLAPQGTAKVKAPLSQAIPYDKLAQIRIPYSVTSSGKTVSDVDNFVGLAVKRFAGDWKKIPSFAITNGEGKNKSAADFSVRAQLAWDKDNFYIRVTVTDDIFDHTEYVSPGGRYQNDSMQIFIDTRCSARKKNIRTFDDDDYAYTFILDKGKPKLFRWRTPDMQLTLGTAAPKDMTIAEDIPCKFEKTKTGYIYETAIPARYMLPARLEKNYAMGFALYVHDKDGSKKIKQSRTMTPEGTTPFNKPYLYPVILLTE